MTGLSFALVISASRGLTSRRPNWQDDQVHIAVQVLAILASVLAVTAVAPRLRVPAPLLLLVVGAIASYVPGVPVVELSPELVLVGLLPPLLYVAALRTSLVDVRAHIHGISVLAVGLVVVAAVVVGYIVAHLLDVPLAVGIAMGAVVAPPDAVAATAVARQIGLPRSVVTVLEGESLLNDASALVTLRSAVAAMAGGVTAVTVLRDFGWAVLAGTVIGLAVALVAARLRTRIEDPLLDTGFSFLVPFLAYLPAESVHASGVIAVVVAGLAIGKKSPYIQTASQRLTERMTWGSLQYLLEHTIFLLMGLQAASINAAISSSSLGWGRIALVSALVTLVVMGVRPIFVFIWRALSRSGRRGDTWQESTIVSWAAMRGVVTLAAAFTLPATTPHREVLVMIALVVTAATMLVQGLTLPWVARVLKVRGPDPREDALQVATVLDRVTAMGVASLRSSASQTESSTVDIIETQSRWRVNAAWERLGRTSEVETPSETYRRLRLFMISAMRREIMALRDTGKADSEVMAEVLGDLDVEEATLTSVDERAEAARTAAPLRSDPRSEECQHLREAPAVAVPLSHECEDCVRDGTAPVHLRMCLTCGYVGCCDSSVGLHATRHYEQSGHPVMRSFEPGEHWRWCYVDSQTG